MGKRGRLARHDVGDSFFHFFQFFHCITVHVCICLCICVGAKHTPEKKKKKIQVKVT